jgi:hypothetical protein
MGAEFSINGIFSTLLSTGYYTVTVTSGSGSPPPDGNFPTELSLSNSNVPLINIHNVPDGANKTIFDGTYAITSVGTMNALGTVCSPSGGHNFCFTYTVPGTALEAPTTPSHAAAEIGLYYNGNNLRVTGGAAGSGTPSPSGSMLFTNQPITILTTTSNSTTASTTNPQTGPDIQNLTFVDSGPGDAYAGLNIGTTNGFNVSENTFSGFSGANSPVSFDVQGGAAIVTNGGQQECSTCILNPWVQFGKIENNHIHAKIGFTSKFKISSVTFDSNDVTCPNPGTPMQGQIGIDIGGLWYLNLLGGLGYLSGGESRIINQQTQSCMIGVLLGGQNNDRVENKLENGGSSACNGTSIYCSIGIAVLDTQASVLFSQSKSASTGIYIDPNSTNNKVYESAYTCAVSVAVLCDSTNSRVRRKLIPVDSRLGTPDRHYRSWGTELSDGRRQPI